MIKNENLILFINSICDEIILEIAKYNINILYIIKNPSNEIKLLKKQINKIANYPSDINYLNYSLNDIKKEIIQLDFLNNNLLLSKIIRNPTQYVKNIIEQYKNYEKELICQNDYHHIIHTNAKYFYNYENIKNIISNIDEMQYYKSININSSLGYQIKGIILFLKIFPEYDSYSDSYYYYCIRGIHNKNQKEGFINFFFENKSTLISDFKVDIENLSYIFNYMKGFINIVFDNNINITKEIIDSVCIDITNNILKYIISNNDKYDNLYIYKNVILKTIFINEMKYNNDSLSRIKNIMKLFRYMDFITSKNEKITIIKYIKEMNKDNKYIYYLNDYNKDKYINSPIYNEIINNKRKIIFIDRIDYNILSYINKCYINDLNTKILVDIGKDNVKLDFVLNNMLNEEEQDKLCLMLEKVYEQNNIYKFNKIKCNNNVNVISTIIKEEYPDESYLYINPRDKIIKKLYDMITDDENNIEVIELCRYIKNIGLLNSNYRLNNPNELIQYTNNLILKNMKLNN